MIVEGSVTAKPFVKWAGGKGALLPQLQQFLPQSFNDYYEPFVGGGALFFSLPASTTAYINDINHTLVSAYKELKTNANVIIAALKVLEGEYLALNAIEQQEFFYARRAEYNSLKPGLRKTILLLFLNKTCFNGLYRENSKGEFNVPFGRHKNPTICNESNLHVISQHLQNTTITSTSYANAVKTARKGDFVYLDPPYFPLNETSSFTAYHQDGFGAKDQEKLRDLFKELDKRGCYVMLSNSSAEFMKQIYADFRQKTVYAGRSINAHGGKRGKVPELVVLNY